VNPDAAVAYVDLNWGICAERPITAGFLRDPGDPEHEVRTASDGLTMVNADLRHTEKVMGTRNFKGPSHRRGRRK
jgi:hypothetical protein